MSRGGTRRGRTRRGRTAGRTTASAGALAVALAALSAAPVQADQHAPTGATTQEQASAPTGALGELHPLAPERLLDTRDGTGAAAAGAVPATSDVVLQVTGRGGVPASGVDSVVLNVTAVVAATDGWVAVRPGDATGWPTTSNLNVGAGETRAVAVTVKVGDDGTVRLFNGTLRPLHLVADVSGWYTDGTDGTAPGAFLHAVTPSDTVTPRVLDTRRPGSGGALAAWEPRRVQVAGLGGVPAEGATAVALNLTVDPRTGGGRSLPGHLTAWGDGPAPNASVLNHPQWEIRSNHVVVPLAEDGTIGLLSPVGAHVVVDVQGWYGDDPAGAGRVVAQEPRRLVDSREEGWYLWPGWVDEELGTADVAVAGEGGVPVGASAALLSVTAVDTYVRTWLTVYPAGSPRPDASAVNAGPGTVANLVATPLGDGGAVRVYNENGDIGLLVDVMAWVDAVD
ncbi:hypothetical protein [Thalassiella azotivora]